MSRPREERLRLRSRCRAILARPKPAKRDPAARPAARGGRIVVAFLLAAIVAGCGSTPAPTPSPSPTPDIPALAPAAVVSERVTAFYYLWYGSVGHDGAWRHWNQNGHQPPADIASAFYPARGPYSSRDPALLASQMREIHAAGIGVVAVSWWGRGGWEDGILDDLFRAAAGAGVRIAFHIEPYTGRSAASIAADVHDLLGRYGSSPALFRIARPTSASANAAPRPVFYVFNSALLVAADVQSALAPLRGTADDAIVLVQSPRSVSAQRAGADGIYSYDIVNVGPDRYGPMVDGCQSANIICSVSVGPGFDNREAVPNGSALDRQDGARYDADWQGAIGSGSEWVSIVSYNEWHEGTQIEPAVARALGARQYAGYEGAYGETGASAQLAYLRRTQFWLERLAPSP